MSKHAHGKPRNQKLNMDLMGRKGGAHDEQRLHLAERQKARNAWKREVEAQMQSDWEQNEQGAFDNV